MEEQAADGTTHKKLSGFDGTYVIYRLDMTQFALEEGQCLHMKQDNDKASCKIRNTHKGDQFFGNRCKAPETSEDDKSCRQHQNHTDGNIHP